MSDQNPFTRPHVDQAGPHPGLMEQMNLPPAMISFIRKNQRIIWIVTICVALVITVVSLFASYQKYRDRKAASALTVARQAEPGNRLAMLEQVVDDYGSTSSGLWARVEIAQLAVEEGRLDDAVKMLSEIQGDIRAGNPLKPLLHYNLGSLYEKQGSLDRAAGSFLELTGYQGFEATAYRNLGRIYELQDNKEQAIEAYRKYLDLTGGEEGGPQLGAAPDRQIIESRISQLQN